MPDILTKTHRSLKKINHFYQWNKSHYPGQPHYKKAKGKEKTDDRKEQEGTHGHKSQSCNHSGSEDR
ncbi:MAG: hypothetical protein LBU85_07600, partial [Treponema sp.]|nr:hypothetical protein [Treponema sp.]